MAKALKRNGREYGVVGDLAMRQLASLHEPRAATIGAFSVAKKEAGRQRLSRDTDRKYTIRLAVDFRVGNRMGMAEPRAARRRTLTPLSSRRQQRLLQDTSIGRDVARIHPSTGCYGGATLCRRGSP